MDFDVARLGDSCEFGDELFGIIHVFENMRTDGIVECAITKRKMVRICHHNRAINDDVATAFRVVEEKFVNQNVGTWIWIIATTDFEDEARFGRVEVLFHAVLIQFIARKAIMQDIEVFEGHTRADGHAVGRLVGHVARHAGHIRQQVVDAT